MKIGELLTTDDLGLAIRDHLEDHDICFREEGERHGQFDTVEFIDCSDASNPVVHMLNGQRFFIRIIAA